VVGNDRVEARYDMIAGWGMSVPPLPSEQPLRRVVEHGSIVTVPSAT
jgi:hypothetical protein